MEEVKSFKEREEIHLLRFNEFITQINLVQEQELLPEDMEVVFNENNSFSIYYQDRELVAKFSFAINSINELKGYITCFKKPESPGREEEIYRLSFDEYGVADIPGGKPNEAYKINHQDVARKLLSHWMLLLVIKE